MKYKNYESDSMNLEYYLHKYRNFFLYLPIVIFATLLISAYFFYPMEIDPSRGISQFGGIFLPQGELNIFSLIFILGMILLAFDLFTIFIITRNYVFLIVVIGMIMVALPLDYLPVLHYIGAALAYFFILGISIWIIYRLNKERKARRANFLFSLLVLSFIFYLLGLIDIEQLAFFTRINIFCQVVYILIGLLMLIFSPPEILLIREFKK